MSVGDGLAIYAALLSTGAAAVQVWAWMRRRRPEPVFRYGWQGAPGHHPILRIMVINPSRHATLDLLQVGWESPGGLGDIDEVTAESWTIEPRKARAFFFEVHLAPEGMRGFARLTDERCRFGGPIGSVPSELGSDRPPDIVTFTNRV